MDVWTYVHVWRSSRSTFEFDIKSKSKSNLKLTLKLHLMLNVSLKWRSILKFNLDSNVHCNWNWAVQRRRRRRRGCRSSSCSLLRRAPGVSRVPTGEINDDDDDDVGDADRPLAHSFAVRSPASRPAHNENDDHHLDGKLRQHGVAIE